MPVLENNAMKSFTFLPLPEIHQATLDKLHLLMQSFPKVIIDMNALKSESREYQATPDVEFSAYFD